MVRFQAVFGSLVRKRGAGATAAARRASLPGENASHAALADMTSSSSDEDLPGGGGATSSSDAAATVAGGKGRKDSKGKQKKGDNWRSGPGEASSKEVFGGGATGKQTDFVVSPPRRKDKFARIEEARQARHNAMATVIATSATVRLYAASQSPHPCSTLPPDPTPTTRNTTDRKTRAASTSSPRSPP